MTRSNDIQKNRMRILIVEDEPLAVAQLATHISALKPDAELLAVCDTIKSTVTWLENNEAPDLAFFDIQLGDGLSFEIFDKIQFTQPVIFTTAFEEYAIKAFKVNSIDYILKPIQRNELSNALQKFENLQSNNQTILTPDILHEVANSLKQKNYKERFLVKVGTHLKMIETTSVSYFYSFEKGTYAKLNDGKDYLLDQSLEYVENLVSPVEFFRINRKYIVSLKSVNDVITYGNSRLKLKIANAKEDDFFVARERVKAFKTWLEGEIQ